MPKPHMHGDVFWVPAVFVCMLVPVFPKIAEFKLVIAKGKVKKEGYFPSTPPLHLRLQLST